MLKEKLNSPLRPTCMHPSYSFPITLLNAPPRPPVTAPLAIDPTFPDTLFSTMHMQLLIPINLFHPLQCSSWMLHASTFAPGQPTSKDLYASTWSAMKAVYITCMLYVPEGIIPPTCITHPRPELIRRCPSPTPHLLPLRAPLRAHQPKKLPHYTSSDEDLALVELKHQLHFNFKI